MSTKYTVTHTQQETKLHPAAHE